VIEPGQTRTVTWPCFSRRSARSPAKPIDDFESLVLGPRSNDGNVLSLFGNGCQETILDLGIDGTKSFIGCSEVANLQDLRSRGREVIRILSRRESSIRVVQLQGGARGERSIPVDHRSHIEAGSIAARNTLGAPWRLPDDHVQVRSLLPALHPPRNSPLCVLWVGPLES